MDAEVGVVGVGTMGSMACWQLAEQGVDVLGFEQFAPGHDRSGAGGESRLFRTAYLEGSEYVPLLVAAQRYWRDLEARSGARLLDLNGGLMIGAPDEPLLINVQASIDAWELPYQRLDPEQAAARYPQHRLRPGEEMILDLQAGYLRPEIAVAMAARRAEELGARIGRYAPVSSIEPDADGVTIRLADGGIRRVGSAVVTSGAWSNSLLGGLPELAVQRLVMTWFPARNPALFEADRFPIFIRNTAGYDISGWPCLDQATVKVAINYGYDRVEEPDRLDRTVPAGMLRMISDAVAEFLPDLIPDPVRVGAYMDGYTADHHAVVGALPGTDRMIVACGFSGHGFKMAPAIGAAIADLVIKRRTDLPIEQMRPDRFSGTETAPVLRTVAGQTQC